MAYKSELDRFDMERGDVLSFTREIAKAIAGFGVEIGGPILFELVKWFSGNPDDEPPKMADPRDNGFLAMLMEHQRKNAARRADFLAKQSQNAQKRWNNAKTSHGIPRHTTAQVQGKEEVEEESPKGKDFPSSTTSNLPPNKLGQAGDAPAPAAGGTCVNAAPCGTRTVTRVAYFDPEWGNAIEGWTFDEAELRARPVSFMLEAIDETGDQRTRNALTKAVEELGPDRFAETCWRFVADMVQAENEYAAVATKARETFAKRYGDEAEAKLSAALKSIRAKGSTNPDNNWFVVPWQKWRDFTPGRFLMAALNEARLAAGIPTKRKPGKRKGGEA